jgi:hypothetical protein
MKENNFIFTNSTDAKHSKVNVTATSDIGVDIPGCNQIVMPECNPTPFITGPTSQKQHETTTVYFLLLIIFRFFNFRYFDDHYLISIIYL